MVFYYLSDQVRLLPKYDLTSHLKFERHKHALFGNLKENEVIGDFFLEHKSLKWRFMFSRHKVISEDVLYLR